MIPSYVTGNVSLKDLDAAPLRPEQILDGKPVARATTIGTSPDEQLSFCLWDCSAGTFRWTFYSDEIVHILEGEVHVRVDERGSIAKVLVPGDVAYFPRGLVMIWEVPEYVKKLAIHRSADASLPRRALGLVSRLLRRA